MAVGSSSDNTRDALSASPRFSLGGGRPASASASRRSYLLRPPPASHLPVLPTMVSADNLNYDVLLLIFAYLGESDLASVAAASQAFWAGALPLLYKTLPFRYAQAKGYPRVSFSSANQTCLLESFHAQVMTPFAVLRARPSFAVFVRNVGMCPRAAKLELVLIYQRRYTDCSAYQEDKHPRSTFPDRCALCCCICHKPRLFYVYGSKWHPVLSLAASEQREPSVSAYKCCFDRRSSSRAYKDQSFANARARFRVHFCIE
jgi:hypothetical protein